MSWSSNYSSYMPTDYDHSGDYGEPDDPDDIITQNENLESAMAEIDADRATNEAIHLELTKLIDPVYKSFVADNTKVEFKLNPQRASPPVDWVLPVAQSEGSRSSPFMPWRNLEINGVDHSGPHVGYDIGRTDLNTRPIIVAPHEGEITYRNRPNDRGYYATITFTINDIRYEVLLQHLEIPEDPKIYPANGSHVDAGTPIGIMGNTGIGTAVHLHMDMRANGVTFDYRDPNNPNVIYSYINNWYPE
jgi:murein DD-endopeptidase MepM/ murein hydrolase activator NlpD